MKGYIQALIDNQNRRLKRAKTESRIYMVNEIEDRIEELKDILEYLNQKETLETKQEVPSLFIKSTGRKLIRDLERELGVNYVKNI